MVWPISWEEVAIGEMFGRTDGKVNRNAERNGLLQLRVLRVGFLQDRNVLVGVFPRGEEVLIGSASFGGVARKSKASRQAEASQGDMGRGPESGFVIENFLELGHRLRALFGLEISEAAQVDRYAARYVAELVGLCGAQLFDGFGAIAALQFDAGANLRNCQLLDKGIKRIVLGKLRGDGVGLRRFAASGEHKSSKNGRVAGFAGRDGRNILPCLLTDTEISLNQGELAQIAPLDLLQVLVFFHFQRLLRQLARQSQFPFALQRAYLLFEKGVFARPTLGPGQEALRLIWLIEVKRQPQGSPVSTF